jgi:hypothetical protein
MLTIQRRYERANTKLFLESNVFHSVTEPHWRCHEQLNFLSEADPNNIFLSFEFCI